jgi:DNA-binding XRE family transcriptional regulator
MKERIIQIMNAEKLSSSKFAEEIGIQRAAMSHILNERNKPSLDVLIKIITRFPNINPEWLLVGAGEMKRYPPDNQMRKDPDLFANVSAYLPKEGKTSDYQKENKDTAAGKKTVSPVHPSPVPAAIKETFVSIAPGKRIKQIMIFFSDNTFETFRPEKTD